MPNLVSPYYSEDVSTQAKSDHRRLIGGMWDEIGGLQFNFMASRGLKPSHHFLDLGCGSFRGGVHFVPYLDSGHYYGLDMSQDLLDLGYEREIKRAGLDQRLPKSNLVCSEDFDFSAFPVQFDRVLAVSVFTHLTFNHIRACLERLADKVAIGGEFYATYFLAPEGHPTHKALRHEPGGFVTYAYSDPYHYRPDDLDYATRSLPWRFNNVGAFGHPRDQQMAMFARV